MGVPSREVPLVELSEIGTGAVPQAFRDHRRAVDEVVGWIHGFLCKPHPDLGRPGPVCPFVPTAIEKRLLHLAVHGADRLGEADMHDLLLSFLDRFLEMEPRSGNDAQFKAILILFPGLPPEESHSLVEKVQEELRFKFVPRGLMVGEFHPGPPEKGGLWNEAFRPLDCPVPMLAIRHMVPTDILFLKNERSLIAEYLAIYGDMVPARFRSTIEEASRNFGFDLPGTQGQSSAPSVIYHLQESGISYQIHRHSAFPTEIRRPQDFAAALGYDLARISKTLFLRSHDRRQYAFAVLGATRKADLTRLAAAMGTGRVEMASREDLAERVGLPPFSVTPIGIEDIPTFMDAELLDHETILTGSGVERMEIELAPDDLRALISATVLALSDPE